MARNRFCTGCGKTFSQTHLLRNHRRTDRCGGEFLPQFDRWVVDVKREQREAIARIIRREVELAKKSNHYHRRATQLARRSKKWSVLGEHLFGYEGKVRRRTLYSYKSCT